MILVVDDLKDILEFYGGKCLTADNAEDATKLIQSGSVTKVYCDFHGIAKGGYDALTILELCRKNSIAYYSTTSDDRAIVGVQFVSKTQAMKDLKNA